MRTLYVMPYFGHSRYKALKAIVFHSHPAFHLIPATLKLQHTSSEGTFSHGILFGALEMDEETGTAL